jgi:hypothetical protein
MFFLGSDDLAKNVAKELDSTFDVTIGGSVDGEAVYPLDPPGRENLSHLVRVADDHLRAELIGSCPLVGEVGVDLGDSLRMSRCYAAARQESDGHFGAVAPD